jgi:hypothetical protein
MPVEECDVPAASAIDRRVVDAAFFRDAYRTPLACADAGVTDIFFGVFGHHPPWMKRVLIVRNRLAVWCGLEAPTRAEIMCPAVKARYVAGDKIGPWPVFSLTETELVAGRDNRHLDFRLSVLKQTDGGAASAVISTVCTTHNAFGRLYLRVIIPFHRWGVRHLISRAIAAGRL